MKGTQWAVSSQCTWRRQRPQQYPLTLVHLISRCTFLPLFPLHFSHVLSYMISLEPDKTPSEGFCSWGHRPGSVSGLQLLIILSLRRLEDCRVWGTPYRIPCTLSLTWVTCTSSPSSITPALPDTPFLQKDIMVLHFLETIELVDKHGRYSGAWYECIGCTEQLRSFETVSMTDWLS